MFTSLFLFDDKFESIVYAWSKHVCLSFVLNDVIKLLSFYDVLEIENTFELKQKKYFCFYLCINLNLWNELFDIE